MLTDYAKNKLIDALHGKNPTFPTTFYAAGSTTTPTAAGTNFTEPSAGTGYVRPATPASSWAAATSGLASNTTAIAFNAATSSQGTWTYLGFWDAPTGGNLWSYDDLPTPQSVPAGVQPIIAVGQAVDSI